MCNGQIPPLYGRSWHGVTAIDYTLIVCGGQIYGQYYDNLCYTINTNEISPVWYSMASMPIVRGEFQFVTYGDAAFAIGGYNNGFISRVDRWTKSQGWVTVASYPRFISRFCAVADEGKDKIYSMGGITDPGVLISDMYEYKVSTNQWKSMPNLYYARMDLSCTIIRRKDTGNKIIIAVGGGSSLTQYFDLTGYEQKQGGGASGGGNWFNGPTAAYSSEFTRIVSRTPFESYEVIETHV